jgi:hypothetical protein
LHVVALLGITAIAIDITQPAAAVIAASGGGAIVAVANVEPSHLI